MEHTQGPWTCFVGNANGRGLIRIESSSESPIPGKHICSMPRGGISEQNAQLIAAAPELYEALKEMYKICDMSPDDAPHRVKARLALSKAEGK